MLDAINVIEYCGFPTTVGDSKQVRHILIENLSIVPRFVIGGIM